MSREKANFYFVVEYFIRPIPFEYLGDTEKEKAKAYDDYWLAWIGGGEL